MNNIDTNFTADSFFKYYIRNPSEAPNEFMAWSLTIITYLFTLALVPLGCAIAFRNWEKVKPRVETEETREWKIFNRIFNKASLHEKCENSDYSALSTDEKLIAAECYCLNMAGFNRNPAKASEILNQINSEEGVDDEIVAVREKIEFIEDLGENEFDDIINTPPNIINLKKLNNLIVVSEIPDPKKIMDYLVRSLNHSEFDELTKKLFIRYQEPLREWMMSLDVDRNSLDTYNNLARYAGSHIFLKIEHSERKVIRTREKYNNYDGGKPGYSGPSTEYYIGTEHYNYRYETTSVCPSDFVSHISFIIRHTDDRTDLINSLINHPVDNNVNCFDNSTKFILALTRHEETGNYNISYLPILLNSMEVVNQPHLGTGSSYDGIFLTTNLSYGDDYQKLLAYSVSENRRDITRLIIEKFPKVNSLNEFTRAIQNQDEETINILINNQFRLLSEENQKDYILRAIQENRVTLIQELANNGIVFNGQFAGAYYRAAVDSENIDMIHTIGALTRT